MREMKPPLAARLLPAFLMLGPISCHDRIANGSTLPASSRRLPTYSTDGRMPLDQLYSRFASLSTDHGWQTDTVYAYPDDDRLPVLSWRTPLKGKAIWILAGIHGEEPAGPNAIAHTLENISALADAGVPIVLLPMCNPKAYSKNWRYPDTPERDWRKGGHSVGDAEYLLPDLNAGDAPRTPKPAGPDSEALTSYALRLSESYPPLLVLDLHEDELSTEGGYIYFQGSVSKNNPVGSEIIHLLRSSGIPIRLSGKTRFGEPVEDGMVSRDDQGLPIRDGSIDELFASTHVFRNGKKIAGPAAPAVFVVETPAFSGSNLVQRVAAHSAILARVGQLWAIKSAAP